MEVANESKSENALNSTNTNVKAQQPQEATPEPQNAVEQRQAESVQQQQQQQQQPQQQEEDKEQETQENNGGKLPEIPHITANYVPLSGITSNVVQHTYAELLNLLETLPSVSSDMARKRRLLDFVIKSRQEFVKLYVLAKWAGKANEVSKCIDVVAWLSGQQNCYANVVNQLFTIERMLGGAKLRNPDVETAMEVLRTGQPFQKSYGYIRSKPLTAKAVYKTLTNLNVLLSIRLALTEQLPPQYRNYEIANGKVKFSVENCYVLDLGIANDSVDARFFLVDFSFCFNGARTIPLGARSKLEVQANQMLATKPLSEVFDWLLRFSQNYKLAVIHEALNDLEGGLWANVLKHSFHADKSLIAVHYWINRPGNKNMIEIGITKKTNKIGIRWLRDGHTVDRHGITFTSDMGVEALIGEVIRHHIQRIISNVYDSLKALFGEEGEDCVTRVNDYKLRIQLTASKFTTYSIDTQTGRAILQNPTPIIASAEKQLNELSDRSRLPGVLFRLRHLMIQDDITSRATATGWVACNSVSIGVEEMRRNFGNDTKVVFAMRRPSWSLKWFLMVSIASSGRPRWWVSQLEYRDNSWTVRFLEQVHVENREVYDYKLFDKLATFTTGRIQAFALGNHLQMLNVRHTFLRATNGMPLVAVDLNGLLAADENLTATNKSAQQNQEMSSKKVASWAKSGLLLTHSGKNIVAQGQIQDRSNLQSVPSVGSGVSIDSQTGRFQVQVNGEDYFKAVNTLVEKLRQIERVVGYVETVKKRSMKLLSASLTEIEFAYGQDEFPVTVKLDEDNVGIHLTPENPHYDVCALIKGVLRAEGLGPVLWLLKMTLPLYEAIKGIKSRFPNLLVTPRSVTDVRLFFPSYRLDLQLRVRRHQGQQMCLFATDVDFPVTAGVKLQQNIESSRMLKPLWTNKNEKDDQIVPLVCGAVCPIGKSASLLRQIEEALVSNTVSVD